MTMPRSSDVTSFTEHRQRLREQLRRAGETGRPLFVTTNGVTDAVVLSPAAYDALVERAELAERLRMLVASEDDITAGRTTDAKSALRRLASEQGIDLDR